jgi:hypothetical protein
MFEFHTQCNIFQCWVRWWMLGWCINASLLISLYYIQPIKSTLHNPFLNCTCIIRYSLDWSLPTLVQIYYVDVDLCNIKHCQKIMCHNLWLWLWQEWEAHNWLIKSILFMNVVYSRSTSDVGIFPQWPHSYLALHHVAYMRRTWQLSFHITQLVPLLSCMA